MPEQTVSNWQPPANSMPEERHVMDSTEWKPVHLEPFVHQVGGQSSMLKFDEHTVCKPLIAREHNFYETLPEEMKEFTPEFRGAIEASFYEDSEGYLTLVGYPPGCREKVQKWHDTQGSCSPGSSGEGGHTDDSDADQDAQVVVKKKKSGTSSDEALKVRMKSSGSIEIEGDHVSHVFDGKDPRTAESAGHNPWSIRCHKQALTKMWKKMNGSGTFKFILLENVASKFQYPCILDLKMGTRQHGDDDNEQKRQRKQDKCAATTTASLGLRVTGMQVFQLESRRFICHNKYYGRTLKTDGFKECLYQFLHNGHKVRTDILDPMLDRLRQFHAMISKQNTFRFYTSSLLLMYDGKERIMEPRKSHSQEGNISKSTSHDSISSDRSSNIRRQASESDNDNDNAGGKVHDSRGREKRSDSSNNSSPERSRSRDNVSKQLSRDRDKLKNTAKYPPKVDIRMIDFAHTTHQGFRGDHTVHPGPDKGYLFGLENLIKMFQELKDQYS